MTRYAIGDLQGCCNELRTLLTRIGFSADRDELWFVGDLVNRGPQSLETLRFVRALGNNARVVLGNHDLHLLAVAIAGTRKLKRGDTLDDILAAPDRDVLLEWLISRPLVHHDAKRGDLLVHAGLVPQWTAVQAAALAREVERALAQSPRKLFEAMYGDEPDRWDDALTGADRLRFVINALTRLRVCTRRGRVDLKIKVAPDEAPAGYEPWYAIPERASRDTRIVFGHWSTLGYLDAHHVLGLDTGCVWGGALTAVNLDETRPPIQVPCGKHQAPGGD